MRRGLGSVQASMLEDYAYIYNYILYVYLFLRLYFATEFERRFKMTTPSHPLQARR